MRRSTGLAFVASLGAPRAASSFTMLSGSLRRSSGVVGGARRGMMAFLGSTAGVPSSSSTPKSTSRWVSTVMTASAQSVVSDGPSLSVHQKKDAVSHAAYDIVEEDFVAEYGATTTLYKHKKSGAEVLSVQIDDDNKVWCACCCLVCLIRSQKGVGANVDLISERSDRSLWAGNNDEIRLTRGRLIHDTAQQEHNTARGQLWGWLVVSRRGAGGSFFGVVPLSWPGAIPFTARGPFYPYEVFSLLCQVDATRA